MTPTEHDALRFHADHERRRSGTLPAFANDVGLRTLLERVETHQSHAGTASENPYALQADTLDLLKFLLDALSPRSIVEFGSGQSTRLFAAWAAAHQAFLVSVEHDRKWIDEVVGGLDSPGREASRIVHAPLRPKRFGLRQFLTYRSLSKLQSDIERADLFLLDGPHISGREVVLYFTLSHCRPGAVVVVDDFRHYAVYEMIRDLVPSLAACFAAVVIDDNSHGLLVLQCVKRPEEVRVPGAGARAILRSYWRCLRDLRQYGTGD